MSAPVRSVVSRLFLMAIRTASIAAMNATLKIASEVPADGSDEERSGCKHATKKDHE